MSETSCISHPAKHSTIGQNLSKARGGNLSEFQRNRFWTFTIDVIPGGLLAQSGENSEVGAGCPKAAQEIAVKLRIPH